MVVTKLLDHDCINLVGTTLIMSTTLLYKLLIICAKLVDNFGLVVRTQLVDGVLTIWCDSCILVHYSDNEQHGPTQQKTGTRIVVSCHFTGFLELVNKLQQTCQCRHQVKTSLLKSGLLQLVTCRIAKTACSKPVNNKLVFMTICLLKLDSALSSTSCRKPCECILISACRYATSGFLAVENYVW